MRIYDARLGRFLSVDPLTKEYPWNSTYSFAENDVIRSIDVEGAEKEIRVTKIGTNSDGKTIIISQAVYTANNPNAIVNDMKYADYARQNQFGEVGTLNLIYDMDKGVTIERYEKPWYQLSGVQPYGIAFYSSDDASGKGKETRKAFKYDIVDIDDLLELLGQAKDANWTLSSGSGAGSILGDKLTKAMKKLGDLIEAFDKGKDQGEAIKNLDKVRKDLIDENSSNNKSLVDSNYIPESFKTPSIYEDDSKKVVKYEVKKEFIYKDGSRDTIREKGTYRHNKKNNSLKQDVQERKKVNQKGN